MTLFPRTAEREQQCLKAVGVALFIITPGSLLVLPFVAWWVARRGQLQRASLRSR